MSYPPHYCEAGARLRMAVTDCALAQRQAQARLVYWTDKAGEAADEALAHGRDCLDCKARAQAIKAVPA